MSTLLTVPSWFLFGIRCSKGADQANAACDGVKHSVDGCGGVFFGENIGFSVYLAMPKVTGISIESIIAACRSSWADFYLLVIHHVGQGNSVEVVVVVTRDSLAVILAGSV